MKSYWDIDDKSGEFDDEGNMYNNSEYRITPTGDIEHLGENGWEIQPQKEFSPNFDDDDF